VKESFSSADALLLDPRHKGEDDGEMGNAVYQIHAFTNALSRKTYFS
jgi:hypothetical protein